MYQDTLVKSWSSVLVKKEVKKQKGQVQGMEVLGDMGKTKGAMRQRTEV